MRLTKNIPAVAVLLLAPVLAMTQDTDTNNSAASSVSTTMAPNAGQLSDGSQVRRLGSASSFLASDFGLTHWGPLSLGRLALSQAYASSHNVSPTLLTEMQTSVVAQHQFARNNFVFQYSPKLTIVDGQFLQNFSNQDSSLSTVYLLNP